MDSANTLARAAAADLARRLETCQKKIVLAESCTAGMAVALLGGCPGISAWLCGSAVTYRQATKTQWLDIAPALLQRFSAESAEATREMAEAVLEKTPEADLAAAITGHLGPNAPPSLDGKIFITIAIRKRNKIEIAQLEHQLTESERCSRQLEAAVHLLRCVEQKIARQS